MLLDEMLKAFVCARRVASCVLLHRALGREQGRGLLHRIVTRALLPLCRLRVRCRRSARDHSLEQAGRAASGAGRGGAPVRPEAGIFQASEMSRHFDPNQGQFSEQFAPSVYFLFSSLYVKWFGAFP